MRKHLSFTLLVSFLILFISASAKAEVGKLRAFDSPNDAGESIDLEWDLIDSGLVVKEMKVFRSDAKNGKFVELASLSPAEISYADKTAKNGNPYFYRLVVNSKNGIFAYELEEPVIAKGQWFDSNTLNLLIIAIILCVVMIYYIETAKRGKKHFIRKIAGLDAVEEAIGRSTEMGRPLLYLTGIMDLNDVQTLAGLNILGMVASKVAEYDTPLMVPTISPLAMSTAREIVKEAYVSAGRLDAFDERRIYYVTSEQFGFVAAVNGLIMRDKPATCIYMGSFYAESLVLAEVGNSIGAIQIAGTAQPSQLPFFVAACDYTLMGEELFAASAYLSQNPQEIGSLKGQDIGKLFAMIAIIAGTIFCTISSISSSTVAQDIANFIIKFFTA